MAKAATRPKEKADKDAPTITPDAHDAPGLSPLERMTDLTRRIVNVPARELARARAKNSTNSHR